MDYWAVNNIYYYPGATWTDGGYTLSGYSWQEISIYNQSVDGETNSGGSHGLLRRLIIGGNWLDSSHSGSRSSVCHNFSSGTAYAIGARGCKENRNILGLVGMKNIIIWRDIIGQDSQYIMKI